MQHKNDAEQTYTAEDTVRLYTVAVCTLSDRCMRCGIAPSKCKMLPLGFFTIWMVFTPHQNAMQVAFCAAVRDVAPVVLAVNFPKLGKPLQHADLQISDYCLSLLAVQCWHCCGTQASPQTL